MKKMTRLIVCSDSHGCAKKIQDLFNSNSFDYFVFLGDGILDLGTIEYLPNVLNVKGNCDVFSDEIDELILNIENKHILLTHGHKYKVKYGLGGVVNYAKSMGVDIVLYGHTHSFAVDNIDNVTLLNPGSLKQGSALILEIDKNQIKYKKLDI